MKIKKLSALVVLLCSSYALAENKHVYQDSNVKILRDTEDGTWTVFLKSNQITKNHYNFLFDHQDEDIICSLQGAGPENKLRLKPIEGTITESGSKGTWKVRPGAPYEPPRIEFKFKNSALTYQELFSSPWQCEIHYTSDGLPPKHLVAPLTIGIGQQFQWEDDPQS